MPQIIERRKIFYSELMRKKVVVGKLAVTVTLAKKIENKTLPALVIGSTSFSIAGRTLFVTDIMTILKAITA
jgi:hypothetical protein